MAQDKREIRLDVHIDAPTLLERLVTFVEESEGVPGGLRTASVGNTYLLETNQRLWTRRTEVDGCSSLHLDTLSYEWEDVEAEGGLPAFRGKRQHECRALRVDLRPWGEGHTELIAQWYEPEGEDWAGKLLAELAKHRPEVAQQLAELAIAVEPPRKLGFDTSAGHRTPRQ